MESTVTQSDESHLSYGLHLWDSLHTISKSSSERTSQLLALSEFAGNLSEVLETYKLGLESAIKEVSKPFTKEDSLS